MPPFFRGRGEHVLTALVITMVLMGLAALAPTLAQRLAAAPVATPTPTPTTSAPPAAVLLPDELDKALQGVMTLANDRTFGSAFLIDGKGDFLTASSLVQPNVGLRLIDNTGGTHSVRLMGTDAALGVAMVRATADGSVLSLGRSSGVKVDDPLVLLASPKVANLDSSSPATVRAEASAAWRLNVDDRPGNLGGPVVGPGALVVALLTNPGTALPIDLAKADISAWQAQAGSPVPLAPFPASLQLRGSDTTTTPGASLTIESVNPTRVSAGRDSTISISGNGFIAGRALRVRFLPLAGSSGAFDGLAATVANASTLTAKIPAGQAVGDYVIELVNGDGALVDSRVGLTITP